MVGFQEYRFQDYLKKHSPISGVSDGNLKPSTLEVFQMNIGKWCNQACHHCHVDASPKRTEYMNLETMNQCIRIIAEHPQIHTVDITGGAPEGNPNFRYLVQEIRKMNRTIIDRCNLTILSELGFEDLCEFLASNQVVVFSSLPHFTASYTDKQRGDKVFEKSVAGLKKLNSVGYGDSIPLNLVCNPTGLYLSSSQAQMEYEFLRVLSEKYDIQFNHLFVINNMPINRFLESLVRKGKYEEYMNLLAFAFNPATIPGLMCRNQISVGYDGTIYDCDFNQMLNLESNAINHVAHFDLIAFENRNIVTASHCLGCTAGAGSSCSGEIA